MSQTPRDSTLKIPEWAKKSLNLRDLHRTKACLRSGCLSTVCEEARCPNITECFSRPTATFLILGDTCTRACGFCSIRKGRPAHPPADEGQRVATAAASMKLRHVVLTSVTRDDLEDQGAGAFAECVRLVRQALPASGVEVLVPDFRGRRDLAVKVLEAGPDVFNHNVETVSRLYGKIRPGADLYRSLEILRAAREFSGDMVIKSGFMVGLGETDDEIAGLLEDLQGAGCDVVTIGQYLQPSRGQVPVAEYRHPLDFERFSDIAKRIGIRYVVSGPLVRSSYRAGEILERIRGDRS